jgi:hypothetical protein
MEGSETLYGSSKFQWSHERISSKSIDKFCKLKTFTSTAVDSWRKISEA